MHWGVIVARLGRRSHAISFLYSRLNYGGQGEGRLGERTPCIPETAHGATTTTVWVLGDDARADYRADE